MVANSKTINPQLRLLCDMDIVRLVGRSGRYVREKIIPAMHDAGLRPIMFGKRRFYRESEVNDALDRLTRR